ncbi:MAG TPA: cysteine hydrolase family protein [Herpetosiphonaceae bacterium]
MSGDTALLILDVQVNMFDAPPPLYRAAEVLERIEALIAGARAARIPIVYVQHSGGLGTPDAPGSPGWQIHPAITPRAEDLVVEKRMPDAFESTMLHHELQTRGIEHVILAGMQTDLCIDSTCRRAVALGYTVTVVADAHSTFASEDATAAAVVEQYNHDLASMARVLPTSEVLALR